MTEFDFDSLIQEAVSRLNHNEREQITDAARRVHAGLAQHEQHLCQILQAEADGIASDLRTTVSELTSQTETLTTTAAILNRSLHPVWGQLPRNLYLGLAALLGLVAGAALMIFAATAELHGLQASMSLLEARKAHLSENLRQFEQDAGFRLVRDGGNVMISLADGFKITRRVSVWGPFQTGARNAWQRHCQVV